MGNTRKPSIRTIAIVGAIVAVTIVGVGVAGWYLTRDNAPPPLSVDALVDGDPDTGSDDASGADLEGTWEVDPGGDSEAGLRIEEQRFGGLPDNTAVGRTPDVTGTLTVVDTQVDGAQFEVDLATIEFTDDPGIPVASRSEYLQTRGLETDSFPTATFVLTSPIDVAGLDGATATTSAVNGELTLHGVTTLISFDVDVRRNGDGFVLGTSAPVPVTLSDHDIEAPKISGVSEVADVGEFEFVVELRSQA